MKANLVKVSYAKRVINRADIFLKSFDEPLCPVMRPCLSDGTQLAGLVSCEYDVDAKMGGFYKIRATFEIKGWIDKHGKIHTKNNPFMQRGKP
jgi:hypothetical protein